MSSGSPTLSEAANTDAAVPGGAAGDIVNKTMLSKQHMSVIDEIDKERQAVQQSLETEVTTLAEAMENLRQKLLDTERTASTREQALIMELSEVQSVLRSERVMHAEREREFEAHVVENGKRLNTLRDEDSINKASRWSARTANLGRRQQEVEEKQKLRLSKLAGARRERGGRLGRGL